MSYMHPAAIEHLRKRWTRPDAYRFAPPGSPKARRPWERVETASAEAVLSAAEQDAFEHELLHLRWLVKSMRLELALRRFQEKYSPDQPRVPAGNPDGGQWTDGGGEGASQDSNDAPQDGASLAQNLGSPLSAASDQPPRSDRPQLEAIASDPLIRAHIDAAWVASNPYGLFPREHGFWISRDEISGQLFTRPFEAPGFENRIDPGSPPPDAIAFFHTHPYGGLQLGAAPPSPDDEASAARVGLPGLIQSHVGMYYFGPPLRPAR